MPSASMHDRRREKTRLALRNALLQLLAETSWDDMTIQQLCRLANVGRSTFYAHFPSKEALLQGSLNDFRLALQARGDKQLLGFLPLLVAHVSEQKNVFHAIIGRRSAYGVQFRFREMLHRLLTDHLSQHQVLATPWAAAFIAGALMDSLTAWLESGSAQWTPTALIAYLQQASLAVLQTPVPQSAQTDT